MNYYISYYGYINAVAKSYKYFLGIITSAMEFLALHKRNKDLHHYLAVFEMSEFLKKLFIK